MYLVKILKSWAGSEYLKLMYDKVAGNCPNINLKDEGKLQKTILKLIESKLVNSVHDISEGGIAVALAECCIINNEKRIGAAVNTKIKTREDFFFIFRITVPCNYKYK